MTYEEAVAFLDDRVRFGMKPGLDRIAALTEALGHPSQEYDVVHVSGTNGKYSVAVMTTALLRALGLTVGTYTSPHLESLCERIVVGGEEISPERFAKLVDYLVPYIELVEADRDDQLTYFELVTAVAFEAFFDRAVHAAVLECGLGGEWDATNVADARVGVVTSIGRDHVREFGDDLGRAAWEKAGIAKAGTRMVTGVADPELSQAVTDRALERGAADVARLGHEFEVEDRRVAVGGQLLRIRGLEATYEDVFLSAFGRAQAGNAALAVAATERFTGTALDRDIVNAVLGEIHIAGRVEVAAHDPLIVLDGGHNPDAVRSVAATISEAFAYDRTIAVVGMLDDKLVEEVLEILAVAADRFWVTAPRAARAAPVERIVTGLVDAGADPDTVRAVPKGVPRAIADALEEATDDDLVLVIGSFTVVGEARSCLREQGLLAHP